MTLPEIQAAIEELRHATRPEQRTSYERALLALADLVNQTTPREMPRSEASMSTEKSSRPQTFDPDKILGPEHAEHVQGVVIRAISRHAYLGIVVRERIADSVAEALTGKMPWPAVMSDLPTMMRPDTVKPQIKASSDEAARLRQLLRDLIDFDAGVPPELDQLDAEYGSRQLARMASAWEAAIAEVGPRNGKRFAQGDCREE